MVRVSNPSNAERKAYGGEKIVVPASKSYSATGKRPVDDVLLDIYKNNYLIEDSARVNQGDYLVHSAELKCSAQSGSKKGFLKLTETIDSSGKKKIGHGANINGLPQANKKDCKSGVNIGSFGECSLLKYETAEVQNKIREAAKSQKVDICTYVRKIISEWITPLESELMEIGGEKAITKASWLLCSPTIITAYRGKGASIGKIEAKNSGQGNLDALLKEYKDAYNVSYNTGIKTVKNIFESFTAQQAYEYIYLYEIRYPERERAFQNFFRKANVDLYLDDILKMKCMTYMLKNESITKKMLEYMGEDNGIYIKISDEQDTAVYTWSLLEGRYINYTHIVETRKYNPAYKTYFHEFGHSIDHAFSGEKRYYSEIFKNSQRAEEYTLTFNDETKKLEIVKKEGIFNKSIHEWAEFDVRNCLIETVCEKLNQKSNNTYVDILLALEVIDGCFFVWDGEERVKELSNDSQELYSKIKSQINNKLISENEIPLLPSDIYGGITADQLGGGHPINYWFHTKGASKGNRKRIISMEAFAGFFEYTALNLQSSINPENLLYYTVKALGGMLNQIL